MAYAKLNGKYIKRNNKPIKVDASIDSNIKPENIKKDIEILGIVGTLEGGGADLQSVLDGLIDGTITEISSQNITSVRKYAFQYCEDLRTVSFPNVTTIGFYAFSHCTLLKNVYIPNATIIDNGVFSYCSNIVSIELSKVTRIGKAAFNTCLDLALFDFRGVTQVPTLDDVNAFGYTPTAKKIVVPDNLYDEWITSTNWSSSTNNIVTSIIKASEYEASL